MHVSLDYETFSHADLKKVGARVYSEHPTTRIHCLQYAIDDAEPVLWTPAMRVPTFMLAPDQFDVHYQAWKCEFEYWIMRNVMKVPTPGPERWTDTMALATHLSLPRSLEVCAKAMGFPETMQKDKRGKLLIQRLSKPQRGSSRPDGGYDKVDRRQLLHEFFDYCAQDVKVEQAIAALLPPMSEFDRRVWEEHMRINIRGIPMDLPNIHHAQRLNGAWREQAMAEIKIRTQLDNPNSIPQMHGWLKTQGIELPDLTMDTLRRLLNLTEDDT